jgi:hypothetical protein
MPPRLNGNYILRLNRKGSLQRFPVVLNHCGISPAKERVNETISGLRQAPFAARRDFCRDVLRIARAMGDSNAILWH